MRLFICDDHKIYFHSLPKDAQGFYIVNYVSSEEENSEMLTLEAIDNVWNVVSNKNTNISLNGVKCDKVPLTIYSCYDVFFHILGKSVKVICFPEIEKFTYASTANLTSITIGSDASCSISCTLPSIRSIHAIIERVENDTFIKANSQDCDIYLNNSKVLSAKLAMGDIIFIGGLKLIWLDSFISVNNPNKSVFFKGVTAIALNLIDAKNYSSTTESERNIKLYTEKDLFFHTPKIKNYIQPIEVFIESPPAPIKEDSIPIILSVGSSAVIGLSSCINGVSAVTGLINGTIDKMSAYLQLAMCFLLLVASFFIPLASALWQKKQMKKKEQQRQIKYKAYLQKNLDYINENIRKQEIILKEKHLTLDEIVNETFNHGYNFWSREVVDKDFLYIRLGIGNMPAQIKIDSPVDKFSVDDDNLRDEVNSIMSEERILKDVPIVISMIENKVTPIVVQNGKIKEYIDGIMLQLLFYYSALDLKICIFTNDSAKSNFEYLKYSNHVWNSEHDFRFFATNDIEANQLSMYLEKEYNSRLPSNSSFSEEKEYDDKKELFKDFQEYYLIITDDFKSFNELSIINRIINSDINVGFSLLVFSDSLKNLPSRLEKFIVIENNQSGVYNKSFDKTSIGKFSAEFLNNYDINQLAFKVSNVALPTESSESSIPKSLSFLDLYNVGKVNHLNILSRWKNNSPMTSLNAPIGVQGNEKLIGLDLHEKAHGPHGLIAGSTGSGKSEFIMTYILSMAVNYHPYEVQFVLIDYKGGGLAGAFEKREKGIKIPHLIGTITNLDKNEMNRTLVSIKSELERRQRKFNSARDELGEGTIDIYKYQSLYREGKVKEPMSHLFIISDEFAELKQQQPDFMDELVSTARIGRSLGVHLILATQKPAGIVNDQIWSNSRFKICLKVQTVEDSMEVLRKDNASKIRETGRFYLQVGNDELFELGQSAWAGDKYYPTEYVFPKINDSLDFISTDGNIIKSVNDDIRQSGTNHGEQLPNIVQYLYDLAVSENIRFNSLWLPSIPRDLYLEMLINKYNYVPQKFKVEAIIGEYDKPTKQEQGMYKIPVNGNTLLFGAQGSGKENFITTYMYSTCSLHSSDEINYYIIDFGAETLSIFNKYPHVGSFITSEEPQRVLSLFLYLEKQIQKRKDLFSDYNGNYFTYCEKSGKTLPLIVVILNSYEGFREMCDDYDSLLMRLLREGTKYGILFVISAVSTNSVRSNMLEYFVNKNILQTQDAYDYQYILGAPNGMIPKNTFGRGICIIDDEPCEFQTAFVCEKDNVSDLVKSVGKKLSELDYFKAPEVKIMPPSATFDDLLPQVKTINSIPLGYEIETADLVNYDLTKNKVTLVLGENTTDGNSFMCTLIDFIDSLKNVKLNIFDISTSVNTDGGAFYYNVDFLEPLKEVLYVPANKVEINVIIGIGFAKDLLNQEESYMLEQIIFNANSLENKYFVIFENYDRFMQLQETNLYTLLKTNSGMWYGDGIEKQKFFLVKELSDYDVDFQTANKVYVINNGDYVTIKGVGY